MITDKDSIYTDPKGDKFLLNQEKSNSFFKFTRVGGGVLPKNLSGIFTALRFLKEAVSRHEHTPDMKQFVQYKGMRDEQKVDEEAALIAEAISEDDEAELPLGNMTGVVEKTKEVVTLTTS